MYHYFYSTYIEHMKVTSLLFALLWLSDSVGATTWSVGPSREYTYCSQVAPLVQHGDTVAIDYATYYNDPQVIWNKNNLYIVGVGGRPRLEAGPIIANDMVNGKGIFVISGSNVHVQNIEFANAVVQDNNGAGIRQEGANLTITNCRFIANEMGILCGNIANCKTTVEYTEFLNGGSTFNPGYQHNIYINHIDTLVFRYNYCHDAIAEGHELKSRATNNFIMYNRIANETTEDSRTIDLPNGGISVVVGNIIEQGPLSANSNLLGYGMEGLSNPGPHHLLCFNNTFINKKQTGNFIQVGNGTDSLVVKNNLFAGARTGGLITGSVGVLDSSHNLVNTSLDVFRFLDFSGYNYHLASDAPARDRGIAVSGSIGGFSLQPAYEYVDTCTYAARPNDGLIDIGAFEYPTILDVHDLHAIDASIFPNPASHELFIDINSESSGPVEALLVSLAGITVLKQSVLPGRNSFDVSTVVPGLYVLILSDAAGVLSQPVVIQP